MDRIAATGVRFDRFFVATPVCSPSRATYLTGLIPSQHGIHDWLYSGEARDGLPNYNMGPGARQMLADATAYTDVLAANGYHCGISGKWHLGDSLTPQHGFDHWFVHQRGGGPYNDAPMVRDGQPTIEPGYVTDVITDEALRFLEAHLAAEGGAAGGSDGISGGGVGGEQRPFYLSVHYTAPHSPWTGHPQEIVDSYDDCAFESCPQEPKHPWAGSLTDSNMGKRESLKGYFAAVTAMDIQIGRLLDWLEAHGQRERTLVVFVSDNGFSCGQHGFWGKGNGTSPRNMYENSIRVPALFSHPGTLPQGHTTDTMVSAYDFMPTLLEYVGLPLPSGQERQADGRPRPGRSFLKTLRGERDAGRGEVVIFDEYGPVRMIRTREWKYVYRHPEGPDELYDLVNDADERRNLIDDAGQAQRITELRARMEAWFAEYVEPERDGLKARLDVGSGGW